MIDSPLMSWILHNKAQLMYKSTFSTTILIIILIAIFLGHPVEVMLQQKADPILIILVVSKQPFKKIN